MVRNHAQIKMLGPVGISQLGRLRRQAMNSALQNNPQGVDTMERSMLPTRSALVRMAYSVRLELEAHANDSSNSCFKASCSPNFV